MNRQLRIRPVALMMGITLVCMLGLPVAGCRVGVGKDCIADSDCKLGLICLKRTQVIDAEIYAERWGSCYSDDDTDKVPADGDNSGANDDNFCGVHAIRDALTQTEIVYEIVLENCDDNCTNVSNFDFVRKFVCLGRDDCCPAPDDRKDKADNFDLCEDLTADRSTCDACFEGDNLI